MSDVNGHHLSSQLQDDVLHQMLRYLLHQIHTLILIVYRLLCSTRTRCDRGNIISDEDGAVYDRLGALPNDVLYYIIGRLPLSDHMALAVLSRRWRDLCSYRNIIVARSNDPNIDRLSLLPDYLLHRILRCLPVKEQIATSFLSRRWRHVWSYNTVLAARWEDSDHTARLYWRRRGNCIFYETKVDLCLKKWRGSYIERLTIEYDLHKRSWDDQMLAIAAQKSVQHLNLFCAGECCVINGLFSCAGSLTSLTLENCILPKTPPDFAGFPVLKSMHLISCTITGDQLGRILSASPLLENLRVIECGIRGRLVVSSTSLCSILVINDKMKLKEVVLDVAPKLRAFWFVGKGVYRVNFACSLPCLVDVTLTKMTKDFMSDRFEVLKQPTGVEIMRIMSPVLHVQTLAIDICILKLLAEHIENRSTPKDTLFKNLKLLHIELFQVTDSSLRALAFLLEECPELETLCLKARKNNHIGYALADEPFYPSFWDYPMEKIMNDVYESDRSKLWQPFKDMDQHGFPQRLKNIDFYGFMGTNNDIRLVKFLVSRASVLELFLFTISRFDQTLKHTIRWCMRSRASHDLSVKLHETCDTHICQRHRYDWQCVPRYTGDQYNKGLRGRHAKRACWEEVMKL